MMLGKVRGWWARIVGNRGAMEEVDIVAVQIPEYDSITFTLSEYVSL